MPRRLPPLRALRAFEAAARHLSFARAAEELHVTPAAVSQQVRQLEEVLGVMLFRRGSPLALTEPAAAALPRITEAFDRLERGVERLTAGMNDGPLVVSAPPSFAARWLVPRLEGFHDRNPGIDLRLSATRNLVDFATEDVDVAIRYGFGNYPGLHVDRLWAEEAVAVASPRLAARLKEPSDLFGCTLLVNEGIAWDPTFPDWRQWFADIGLEAGDLKLRPFEDATLIIEAAMAGLGAALMWRTLVAEEVAAGRLIDLFPARPLANAFHLVCPPARLARPKVAAFRAWLLDEAKARG